MKGDLLLECGHPTEQRQEQATICFTTAIEVARRHGARLFEARAIANLASVR
jgi:hypothetical protein